MMDSWKSELISTVTESEAFPSHNRRLHAQILKHLALHSSREDRDLRTEKYLRQEFFQETYAGKISMYLKRLAEGLDRYFTSEEGERKKYRVEMLRGAEVPADDRYAIRFPLNRKALRRLFWLPYLDERLPTFIAYGVPLFVRNSNQTIFTRYADVNVQSDFKSNDSSDEICWPFVAHGDLLATMELHRWLAGQGISVNFGPFKAGDDLHTLLQMTSGDANVIALGSIRVNGILDAYQRLPLRAARGDAPKSFPFRLRLYDVVQLDNREKEVGTPHEEEKSATMSSVPVVISRRKGAIRNSVTLVASNHGRAVSRACQILTNEDEIHELFQDQRLQPWLIDLPTNFQILLRVNILAHEDMGGSFSVEDVWSC
jgi:hypothetical protein